MALPARCTRRRSPSCCGCSWASRARCCTPPAARAAATAASGAPRRPTPDITDARARRPGPHRAARGARRAGRGRLAAVRLPFPQPHRRPRARGGRDGHQAPVRAAAPARRAARWAAADPDGHRRAARALAEIAADALRWAGSETARGVEVRETSVQRRVLEAIERSGLVTDHPPIVAFQENAALPHYEPHEGADRRLQAGHVLLLDLWAGRGPIA